VVGSCGREGIGRLLVGDNARATLSGATCPVAVAPRGYAEQAPQIVTIGVAYNDTAESEAALALARRLAALRGAEVRALTVVNPLSAAGASAGQLDANWGAALEALEQSGTRPPRDIDGVEGRFAIGFAAEELVAFSEVDLLVVGSRGHGALLRVILGSTSMRLTREARCPLLVVPRPAADRVREEI
jgi:nucleotide-binding universal stress UspA family protein